MKSKLRIITLFLAAFLLLSVLPTGAFAAESSKITKSDAINTRFYYWGGETIAHTFTYADGTTVTTSLGGFAIHYLGDNLTSIVGSKVAYCIEPDTGSTSGTTYSGTESENSAFWNNKLTANQRRAIRLIMLYGAPNGMTSTDADTLFGYEGATQVLIWEIVMGFRSALPPYELSNARLKNNFYYNPTFPSTKTAYDSIVSKMQSHLDVPSFSSPLLNQAPTHTMTYDSASGLYKCTLTDSKGVLSQDYTFTASGVTFSKSGNTLNISAPFSAFANGDVLASATGRSLNETGMAQMIWTLTGRQTVTTFSASPDPVKAYFKLKLPTTSLEIVKQSSDGNVANISFTVKDSSGNTLFSGKTNSSGKLTVPNLTVGQTVTVTETVPSNYVVDQRTKTVTLKAGTNTVTFVNTPVVELEIVKTSSDGNVKNITFTVERWNGSKYVTLGTYKTDANGKILIDSLDPNTKYRITETVPANYTSSNQVQEITTKLGRNTVTFVNTPVVELEIVKTSSDGNVKNITFTVERWNGSKYVTLGTYMTDANGKILIDSLDLNTKYRITETVPANYTSSNRVQEITTKLGRNTVTFVNTPVVELEIIKTSSDGNVKNISFTVERWNGSKYVTLGTYKTDANGKILIDSLDLNTKYRITETVPANYTSSNMVQEITTKLGRNTVTFVNTPVVELEIVKTSSDGNVKNISFAVERWDGSAYAALGTYKTDANGKILIENLDLNTRYRITETVPENYVSDNRVQVITTVLGRNTVTFVNRPTGNLTIQKTSDTGDVDGYCFKVYRHTSKTSWYGKSDSNGKVYLTDNSYSASGEKVYTFTGLTDGTYTFLEALSVKGKDLVFPDSWRITVKNGGTTVFDHTYTKDNLSKDANGDCRLAEVEITGLTGAGTMTMTIHNVPEINDLEILKQSDDGNVSNIAFTVKDSSGTVVFTGATDSEGRLIVPGLTIGQTYTVIETVPEDYEAEKQEQTITVTAGTNTVTFVNHPLSRLELIKTCDDGNVSGLTFKVERYEPEGGIGWWTVDTYVTDEDGRIHVELEYGYRYRVTETVPDGYISEQSVQEFTAIRGTNMVCFVNHRIYGNIELTKVDESYPDVRLTGAEFTVTLTRPDGSTETVPMPEVLDDQGKGTGVYRLEHVEYGTVCEVRETKAPEGFLLSDKTFTVTIEEEKTYNIGDPGFECVTNREKSGIIQVKKVDTQGRAMSGVSFLLEFSLDGRNWAPVTYRETDSAVTAGGCTNQNLDHGILVTDRNGVAVYPGLALSLGDRVLHYRLTEVKTQNGDQLLSAPAFEGTLPYNGAEEITVTAVNGEGFTLPKTGGSGFAGTAIGIGLAGAAALAVLLLLRKRRGSCV